MSGGMLWQLSDLKKKPLAEQVQTAVEYFTRKYQVQPVGIQGSRKSFKGETAVGVHIIVPDETIMKNHLLLQFPDGYVGER